MIIIVCIVSTYYLLMMTVLWSGWQKAVSVSSSSEPIVNDVEVTVLIPFRNEKYNLPLLLADLLAMEGNISLLKVILINDHSNDDCTADISKFLAKKEFSIQLLENTGEGKVAALNTALSHASTEYIVTLDADIRLGKNWFMAIQKEIEVDADLVILPVKGIDQGTAASKYAQIDFMSLIGVTFSMSALKRPVMANGAQLLIKRSHAGWSEEIVSGDDVFMLHKVKSKNGKIAYSLNRELIASTGMPQNWKGVIAQRMRWASKSVSYKDIDTVVLGWSVITVNFLIWVLFFHTVFGEGSLSLFLAMFLFKALLDLLFLHPVMRWFGSVRSLWYFPIAFVINLIQYPALLLASRVKGFKWKERSFVA